MSDFAGWAETGHPKQKKKKTTGCWTTKHSSAHGSIGTSGNREIESIRGIPSYSILRTHSNHSWVAVRSWAID